MTNYITEKDLWQAINSIKNENAKQLYNYMLQLKCRFKVIFPSYERLAAHFQVDVRTIGRWMTELKELYLITDKKRWLQSSLYQINSMVLKFSEKYKQIFPALKHWTENALVGIFGSNVLHNYNDINNSAQVDGAESQSSSFSSSKRSFKTPSQPTFNARRIDSKQNQYTYGESFYFEGQVGYESDMGSMEVNKLTEEEWEEVLVPKKRSIVDKLTITELIEWVRNEANSITTICQ